MPENPRAWARRHAEGADCPTQPWALQKAKITGYTAPSNKYFATRQRLAYHPQATSLYGIWNIPWTRSTLKKTNVAPPPPPAQSNTPPKESGSSGNSAKKQSLENYERDYLARLEQQERESQELHQAAAQLASKRRASSGSTSSWRSISWFTSKGLLTLKPSFLLIIF